MKLIMVILIGMSGNVFAFDPDAEKLKGSSDLGLSNIQAIQPMDIKAPVPPINENVSNAFRSEQTAYASGRYIGMILIMDDKLVRVDNRLPKGIKCGNKNGIDIVCDEGMVKKITVKSRKAHLDRTHVNIGCSLEDIIRFYGRAEEAYFTEDKLVASYKRMGIDFELDKETKKITKIEIYIPIITLPAFSH